MNYCLQCCPTRMFSNQIGQKKVMVLVVSLLLFLNLLLLERSAGVIGLQQLVRSCFQTSVSTPGMPLICICTCFFHGSYVPVPLINLYLDNSILYFEYEFS
jgi:hypothetical protein